MKANIPEPVDFLIVTAKDIERDAVLELLEHHKQVRIDESLIVYTGSLKTTQDTNCNVVVTMLARQGNVEASTHSRHAIQALQPIYVLMVGIAASTCDEILLGDVLVSDAIFYPAPAKKTPEGDQPRPAFASVSHSLLHSMQNYNSQNWTDLVRAERPPITSGKKSLLDNIFKRRASQKPSRKSPKVHFGTIASVEGVVDDPKEKQRLKALHSKLAGIEMESFGVARAAEAAPSNPGFISVRGISDRGENKSDDWQPYAASVAAAFVIGYLRSGIVEGHPNTINQVIAIRHTSFSRIPSEAIADALQATQVIDLEIDQSHFYDDGRLNNPLEAVKLQTGVQDRVDTLLRTYPKAKLGYFGVAHIPLLFLVGYQLSNLRSLLFAEFDRYGQHPSWRLLQGYDQGPELKSNGLPTAIDERYGDVIIRISISDPVRVEEVASVVPSALTDIQLYIDPTKRDVMVSDSQLRWYGQQFRATLDDVHKYYPNRQCIHIFYAGPASLAVYMGQLVNPRIDRKVFVYNYTSRDNPRYSWGIELTADAGDASIVRPSGSEGRGNHV